MNSYTFYCCVVFTHSKTKIFLTYSNYSNTSSILHKIDCKSNIETGTTSVFFLLAINPIKRPIKSKIALVLMGHLAYTK